MTVIETAFTPGASLIGGLLIGAAAVLLMAVRGNVLGATGILSGFMLPKNMTDWAWRAALIAGMLSAPLVYLVATGGFPEMQVPVSKLSMIVGGVIVGVGVTFGNGCTSGHGICGMARFSRRSVVATISFMTAAIVTVFIIRHVIGG